MSFWTTLIPAAISLITGQRQKKSHNRALDIQQQGINAQTALEAKKQAQLDELGKLAKSLLYGASSGPGGPIAGAIPRAEDATNAYFRYLRAAPDLTYNQQRGAFERGLLDTQNALSDRFRRRGLGRSGITERAQRDLGINRARGLSALAGQREARRGAGIEQASNLARSIQDSAINLLRGATGQSVASSSAIPGLLGQRALLDARLASQPAAGSDLLAIAVKNLIDRSSGGGTPKRNPFTERSTIGTALDYATLSPGVGKLISQYLPGF